MTVKREMEGEDFLRLYRQLDERERAHASRLIKALAGRRYAEADAVLTDWLGEKAAAPVIAEFQANRTKHA